MASDSFNIPKGSPVELVDLPDYSKTVKSLMDSGMSLARIAALGNRPAAPSGLDKVMQPTSVKLVPDPSAPEGYRLVPMYGKTPQEREANYKTMTQIQAQKALEADPAIQESLAKLDSGQLSVEAQQAELDRLRTQELPRLTRTTGLPGSEFLDEMLGSRQRKINELRTKINDTSSVDTLLDTTKIMGSRVIDTIKGVGQSAEEELQAAQERQRDEADIRSKNAYLDNQLKLEAEGKSWWDRSHNAETGSTLLNAATGALNVAGDLGVISGTTALGSLAGPVGSFAGAGAGNAAVTVQSFVDMIAADPNLTDEQKIKAIEDYKAEAAGIGAGLGVAFGIGGKFASPLLNRMMGRTATRKISQDAAKAAAGSISPDVAAKISAQGITNIVERSALQGATRSTANTVYRGLGTALTRDIPASALESAMFMGANTVAMNALYNEATGSDRDLTEGLGDALREGALFGVPFGALRTLRRPRRPETPRPSESTNAAAAARAITSKTPEQLATEANAPQYDPARAEKFRQRLFNMDKTGKLGKLTDEDILTAYEKAKLPRDSFDRFLDENTNADAKIKLSDTLMERLRKAREAQAEKANANKSMTDGLKDGQVTELDHQFFKTFKELVVPAKDASPEVQKAFQDKVFGAVNGYIDAVTSSDPTLTHTEALQHLNDMLTVWRARSGAPDSPDRLNSSLAKYLEQAGAEIGRTRDEQAAREQLARAASQATAGTPPEVQPVTPTTSTGQQPATGNVVTPEAPIAPEGTSGVAGVGGANRIPEASDTTADTTVGGTRSEPAEAVAPTAPNGSAEQVSIGGQGTPSAGVSERPLPSGRPNQVSEESTGGAGSVGVETPDSRGANAAGSTAAGAGTRGTAGESGGTPSDSGVQEAAGRAEQPPRTVDGEAQRLREELVSLGVPKEVARDTAILFKTNAKAFETMYGADAADTLSRISFVDGGLLMVEGGNLVYYAQPARHAARMYFDEFSTEHFGTGEGSGVWGWGLYVGLDPKPIDVYFNRFKGDRARLAENDIPIYDVTFNGQTYTVYDVPESLYVKAPHHSIFRNREGVNSLGRYIMDRMASRPTEDPQAIRESLIRDRQATEQFIEDQRAIIRDYEAGRLDYMSEADIAKVERRIFKDNQQRRLHEQQLQMLDAVERGEVQVTRRSARDLPMPTMYNIEIPDDADSLFTQRPFRDQTPETQQRLRKAMDILGLSKEQKERIENAVFTNNGYKDTTLYKLLLDAYATNKGRVRTKYGKFYDEFISDERTISLALNESGIKALRYHGLKDGDCAVVFDGKAIKTVDYYHQAMREYGVKTVEELKNAMETRGTTVFSPETGMASVFLNPKADPSTLLHEGAHTILEHMRRLNTAMDHPQLKADLRTLARYAKLDDSVDLNNLTAAQATQLHEAAARGFEEYVSKGVAPMKELNGVFKRFANWLKSVYEDIKAYVAGKDGIQLNPEVERVFDRWFNPKAKEPPVVQERLARTVEEHQKRLSAELVAAGMPQDVADASASLFAANARTFEKAYGADAAETLSRIIIRDDAALVVSEDGLTIFPQIMEAGSRTPFRKASLRAAGSGEGGDLWGPGLYFAANEGSSRDVIFNGKPSTSRFYQSMFIDQWREIIEPDDPYSVDFNGNAIRYSDFLWRIGFAAPVIRFVETYGISPYDKSLRGLHLFVNKRGIPSNEIREARTEIINHIAGLKESLKTFRAQKASAEERKRAAEQRLAQIKQRYYELPEKERGQYALDATGLEYSVKYERDEARYAIDRVNGQIHNYEDYIKNLELVQQGKVSFAKNKNNRPMWEFTHDGWDYRLFDPFTITERGAPHDEELFGNPYLLASEGPSRATATWQGAGNSDLARIIVDAADGNLTEAQIAEARKVFTEDLELVRSTLVDQIREINIQQDSIFGTKTDIDAYPVNASLQDRETITSLRHSLSKAETRLAIFEGIVSGRTKVTKRPVSELERPVVVRAEVPDDKDCVFIQRSFAEQTPEIQERLRQVMEDLQLPKRWRKYIETFKPTGNPYEPGNGTLFNALVFGYSKYSRKLRNAGRISERDESGRYYDYYPEYNEDRRTVADTLARNGIPGMRYFGGRDGECVVVVDENAVKVIDIFEQMKKAAGAKPGAKASDIAKELNARGITIFTSDGAANVFLTKEADPSTIVHEGGHIFLKSMERLAQETKDQRLIKDLQTLAKYAQIGEYKDILDLTPAQYRQLHEATSRGFEEYLSKGKAPNKELQGVFERFKEWLKGIYENFKAYVAGDNPKVKLSKEVEAVFDRWLDPDLASMRDPKTGLALFDTKGKRKSTRKPAAKKAATQQTAPAEPPAEPEPPKTPEQVIASERDDVTHEPVDASEIRVRDESGETIPVDDLAPEAEAAANPTPAAESTAGWTPDKLAEFRRLYKERQARKAQEARELAAEEAEAAAETPEDVLDYLAGPKEELSAGPRRAYVDPYADEEIPVPERKTRGRTATETTTSTEPVEITDADWQVLAVTALTKQGYKGLVPGAAKKIYNQQRKALLKKLGMTELPEAPEGLIDEIEEMNYNRHMDRGQIIDAAAAIMKKDESVRDTVYGDLC